uniref:Uncharacterized protein n=1 Tax=Romanomermis culicivorax TaxID=13658 RepID=A0A915HU48_ROMCU
MPIIAMPIIVVPVIVVPVIVLAVILVTVVVTAATMVNGAILTDIGTGLGDTSFRNKRHIKLGAQTPKVTRTDNVERSSSHRDDILCNLNTIFDNHPFSHNPGTFGRNIGRRFRSVYDHLLRKKIYNVE